MAIPNNYCTVMVIGLFFLSLMVFVADGWTISMRNFLSDESVSTAGASADSRFSHTSESVAFPTRSPQMHAEIVEDS